MRTRRTASLLLALLSAAALVDAALECNGPHCTLCWETTISGDFESSGGLRNITGSPSSAESDDVVCIECADAEVTSNVMVRTLDMFCTTSGSLLRVDSATLTLVPLAASTFPVASLSTIQVETAGSLVKQSGGASVDIDLQGSLIVDSGGTLTRFPVKAETDGCSVTLGTDGQSAPATVTSSSFSLTNNGLLKVAGTTELSTTPITIGNGGRMEGSGLAGTAEVRLASSSIQVNSGGQLKLTVPVAALKEQSGSTSINVDGGAMTVSTNIVATGVDLTVTSGGTFTISSGKWESTGSASFTTNAMVAVTSPSSTLSASSLTINQALVTYSGSVIIQSATTISNDARVVMQPGSTMEPSAGTPTVSVTTNSELACAGACSVTTPLTIASTSRLANHIGGQSISVGELTLSGDVSVSSGATISLGVNLASPGKIVFAAGVSMPQPPQQTSIELVFDESVSTPLAVDVTQNLWECTAAPCPAILPRVTTVNYNISESNCPPSVRLSPDRTKLVMEVPAPPCPDDSPPVSEVKTPTPFPFVETVIGVVGFAALCSAAFIAYSNRQRRSLAARSSTSKQSVKSVKSGKSGKSGGSVLSFTVGDKSPKQKAELSAENKEMLNRATVAWDATPTLMSAAGAAALAAGEIPPPPSDTKPPAPPAGRGRKASGKRGGRARSASGTRARSQSPSKRKNSTRGGRGGRGGGRGPGGKSIPRSVSNPGPKPGSRGRKPSASGRGKGRKASGARGRGAKSS